LDGLEEQSSEEQACGGVEDDPDHWPNASRKSSSAALAASSATISSASTSMNDSGTALVDQDIDRPVPHRLTIRAERFALTVAVHAAHTPRVMPGIPNKQESIADLLAWSDGDSGHRVPRKRKIPARAH
jgi:hypothetical protein